MRPTSARSRQARLRSSRASRLRSTRSARCSTGKADAAGPMGQIVVTVNGRAFPMNCADGEEPRLRRLAQYVDGKVAEFVRGHGQIGEARLILLAALVIADELSDTNDLVQTERSRARNADAPDETAAVASGIRSLAQRIESIAARLESA